MSHRYARVVGDAIAEYPYELGNLCASNPQVSFPVENGQLALSEAELVRWGVVAVALVEHGADLVLQEPVETTPVFEDGAWRQSWTLVKRPAEDVLAIRLKLADFVGFYDGLIASETYQALRVQAIGQPALLLACAEFAAAFADAKAGRPNRAAIQACISGVIASADLSSEQTAELQALLSSSKMAELFTLS